MRINSKNIGRTVTHASTVIILFFLLYANKKFDILDHSVEFFSKIMIVILLIVFIGASLIMEIIVKNSMERENIIGPAEIRWGDVVDKFRFQKMRLKYISASFIFYTTKMCMGMMMAGFLFLIYKHILATFT